MFALAFVEQHIWTFDPANNAVHVEHVYLLNKTANCAKFRNLLLTFTTNLNIFTNWSHSQSLPLLLHQLRENLLWKSSRDTRCGVVLLNVQIPKILICKTSSVHWNPEDSLKKKTLMRLFRTATTYCLPMAWVLKDNLMAKKGTHKIRLVLKTDLFSYLFLPEGRCENECWGGCEECQ